ncbi:unnamed protein product, partial [Mesorhabditis spiculigera]
MSGTAEFGRKASVTAAVFLSIVGMCLSIAAILTPSWQVVNLREYGSIHEHGLWLDCTRHSRDGGTPILMRYRTITEPLHCVYKFDYDKYSGTFDQENDNSPVGEVNRHKFYGWHTFTMVVLFIAILTTLLSSFLGACSCCYGTISIVFTATTLLTTFLSSVATGVFFFYSHRTDNRFIKGIVGTYEQRVGLAFFLQLAACFFHFFSFLVAMFFTYMAMSQKDVDGEDFSLQRSSRTNVTNIGRSMEFDPMMYPPATPQSNVRPFMSKHEEYERHVAESMPELGMQRAAAYPGELIPTRIRRKSETCV